MAASWGTAYGYIESNEPTLVGVFCVDKKPTAHFATDSLGNETTSIGELPTHPKAKFIIVEDKKRAMYEAKLALLSATEYKILELNYAISDLKLTTETAQLKLKNEYIDEATREHLAKTVASNQNILNRLEGQLRDIKQLRRAKISLKNLSEYESA